MKYWRNNEDNRIDQRIGDQLLGPSIHRDPPAPGNVKTLFGMLPTDRLQTSVGNILNHVPGIAKAVAPGADKTQADF